MLAGQPDIPLTCFGRVLEILGLSCAKLDASRFLIFPGVFVMRVLLRFCVVRPLMVGVSVEAADFLVLSISKWPDTSPSAFVMSRDRVWACPNS